MSQQKQYPRNEKQIFVSKTSKTLVEVMDAMNWEDLKFDKIVINMKDFSNRGSQVDVQHFINPSVMSVISSEILSGSFKGYTEYKGSQKPSGIEARVLKITYNAAMKYPYDIKISKGDGQIIGDGAVKMVKETASVSMKLSEMDMKVMAEQVQTYIRNFRYFHQTKKY